MGSCIAFVSGKGGTGKSTLSCTLATMLSEKNQRVLIIDLDKGLKCQDIFFGIDKDIVFDLSDALSSGNYNDSMYYPKNYKNICVIAAPPKDNEINKELFLKSLNKFRKEFDTVILDMPAGLDFSILEGIDGLTCICVSNSDPISVRGAYAVKCSLNEINISPYLIVNKFDKILMENGLYNNFDDIIDISGLRLLGVVPNSSELLLFPVCRKLKKRGKAYNSLKRISGRLCGERILLPHPGKI